ncbi:MAG: Uma2 family endonuclease, partial [Gemmataceae bacterium]|nr:Uma2 family endonuclease [Gemmataceae bacterium]
IRAQEAPMSPAPTTVPTPKTKFPTFADVQERLGHVPPARVRSFPAPGTATVQDLLDSSITKDRLCELVDGILVEKAMGFREGFLAMRLGHLLQAHLDENNLGLVAGADGLIRFKLDLVRMPDVSFIRWDSVDDPDEIENPTGAFLEVPPDLAVEVISPSNTAREMEIKLAEYAKAGVKLVWYIDPERKEVDVYPKGSAKRKRTLGIDDELDGGAVLPGFQVKVARLFESRAPKKPGKPKKKT